MKRTERRYLPFILRIFLVALLFFAACQREENVDIIILYDNDVHCAIDGYPLIAGLRDDLQSEADYVSIVSCGDFLSGSTWGAISRGSYIVDIMNAVGYDAVTVGNHEFDYRMPRLMELSQQMNASIVCCNFRTLPNEKPVFEPYVIRHYGDVSVAFIGVTTPSVPTLTAPTYFMNEGGDFVYSFGNKDIYQSVQCYVDEVRRNGVDYVIVLSHLGDLEDPNITSTQLIANTTGIDVVLDGHDHNAIESRGVANREGRLVLLTSSGSKFDNIGRLNIKADGTITSQLIPTASLSHGNAAVETVIDRIKEEYSIVGGREIGISQVTMSVNDADGNRIVRCQECAIGDFCADALRYVAQSDVALVNGGGIRADLQRGALTFMDLHEVFPFENQVSVAKVTGQNLIDALENSVKNSPGEFGGFFQVSGIRFVVDTLVESTVMVDQNGIFRGVGGTRRVSDVCVFNSQSGTYEPINPSKLYTVASFDYVLFSHGDGHSFGDIQSVQQGVCLDTEALERYITEYLHGTIDNQYAFPQGRIQFLVGGEK